LAKKSLPGENQQTGPACQPKSVAKAFNPTVQSYAFGATTLPVLLLYLAALAEVSIEDGGGGSARRRCWNEAALLQAVKAFESERASLIRIKVRTKKSS